MKGRNKVLIWLSIVLFIGTLYIVFKINTNNKIIEVSLTNYDDVVTDLTIQNRAFRRENVVISHEKDSLQFRFVELNNNCDSVIMVNKNHINKITKERNEAIHERDSLIAFLRSIQRVD